MGWPASNPKDPVQLVGFTGPVAGQGVSTVATQVAIAAASVFNRRTLLVDCDFDNAILHELFGVKASPGLGQLLVADEFRNDVVQETAIPNLRLMPAGIPADFSVNAEASLHSIFHTLIADHDLVICDIPSSEEDSMAKSISQQMDRLLVVIDKNRATHSELEHFRRRMFRSGLTVSGVVMNRTA